MDRRQTDSASIVEDIEIVEDHDEPARATRAPWADDVTPVAAAFGYLVRLGFFALAPMAAVFVGAMASNRSLTVLIVGTIVFAGVLGRTAKLTERWPWLLKIPLARDLFEVLNRFHAFYFANRPRSFFFYVFYPVSSVVLFPFSAGVRRECRHLAGVLASVALAFVLEFAFTYSSTYPPYLGFGHAIATSMIRFVCSLLVFVMFFIPVATTSFTYHLSGQPWRLRFLVALGMVSAAPMIWFAYTTPVAFWDSVLLATRLHQPSFRDELKKAAVMFLQYHGSRQTDAADSEFAPHPTLTKEFRRHLTGLLKGDEHQSFEVFTLRGESADAGRAWLGVRIRSSGAPRLVSMIGPDGQIYSAWAKLPAPIQQRFRIDPKASASDRSHDPVIGKKELIDDFR